MEVQKTHFIKSVNMMIRNQHIIISLKQAKKYSFMLKKPYQSLSLKYEIFFTIFFFKLIYLIRIIDADIIQTWLIHGDLIGGFAAKLSGYKNIIWNVRYSNLKRKEEI